MMMMMIEGLLAIIINNVGGIHGVVNDDVIYSFDTKITMFMNVTNDNSHYCGHHCTHKNC